MAQATDYSLANQSGRELPYRAELDPWSGPDAQQRIVSTEQLGCSHGVSGHQHHTGNAEDQECGKRRLHNAWNGIDQLWTGQCLWRDVYG